MWQCPPISYPPLHLAISVYENLGIAEVAIINPLEPDICPFWAVSSHILTANKTCNWCLGLSDNGHLALFIWLWLTDFSYLTLVIQFWLSDFGYLTLAIGLWLCGIGYLTLTIWLWLSDFGYLILFIWLWLTDFDYLNLAILPWLPHFDYLTLAIWLSLSDFDYLTLAIGLWIYQCSFRHSQLRPKPFFLTIFLIFFHQLGPLGRVGQ